MNNVLSSIDPEIQACLPKKEAMRKLISRAQRIDTPVEPKTLHDLNIPDGYSSTLGGRQFLRDIEIDNDRILMFSTEENLKYLHLSKFWIMDGTFKTVPHLFCQLHTIHANDGSETDFVIVPLVYALMSTKTEECYRKLFEELIDWADNVGYNLKRILYYLILKKEQ